MAKRQPAAPPPRPKRQPPEKKFAVGGIGVAIWLNTVDTEDGEKSFRSLTIAPRRYQDRHTGEWKDSGEIGPRPSFRVVFLTTGAGRANHILWLAHDLARNKDRRLVFSTTQDVYLSEPNAMIAPILNDHFGIWQSLVDPHPTSPFLRQPIRLQPPVAPTAPL